MASASCGGGGDDDFALLADDSHHHHPQQQSGRFVTHRYGPPPASSSLTGTTTAAAAIPPLLHHNNSNPHHHQHQHHHHPSSFKKNLVPASRTDQGEEQEGEDEDDDDDYGGGGAFCHSAHQQPPPKHPSFHDVTAFTGTTSSSNPPFATQPEINDAGGGGENSSSNNNNCNPDRIEGRENNNTNKRRDRDELSDDGVSPFSFVATHPPPTTAKKPRPSVSPAAAAMTGNASPGDYRKDREEWSDSAIGCLLDAYTDKYIQLNRGNLRGRDWEEVATVVSDRCDKQKSCKSVEQCKNKVDNLKKRYKAERHRLTSGALSTSHWPWFKKMEQIVGSSSAASSPLPKPVSDDDKSAATASALVVAPGPVNRQAKRYMGSTPSPVNLTNNIKMKSPNPRWQRVVLKISGASFAGSGPQNVEPKVTMLIAREISMAVRLGVQVAVVVGGRNLFCGDTWVAATGIDRATAYQIGMMATVMNSVLLQASLERLGVQTRVQTAFAMQEIAEPYIRRRAIRHLEKGRVVIFGGIGTGTGNPLFTTDTAAAIRASEINADAVLKGTSMDSVYNCHSRSSNAMSFEHISYRESLARGYSVMDVTAITFCEENNIPVIVFNLLEPGNISRALCGDQVGTLIDRSAGIS